MKNYGPFILAAAAMTLLSSCALGKAALNAPGLLFKGMNEAVHRAVGLGASNNTDAKPVIDSESVRRHREYLEELNTAPLPTPSSTSQEAVLAQAPSR